MSPARGFFALALLLCAATAARADLYRWVDPETGSVKFSSYPPPWYGDPAKERRAPKVERIAPRAATPAGASTPGSASAPDAIATLRARLAEMLRGLAVLPPKADFDRAGAGWRQQLEAYQAVSTELDRLDPKGAAARRAQAQPVIEPLIEGLKAQLRLRSPTPTTAPVVGTR